MNTESKLSSHIELSACRSIAAGATRTLFKFMCERRWTFGDDPDGSTGYNYAHQGRNEGDYGPMALLALEASKWDGKALPVMVRWSHRVETETTTGSIPLDEGTRISKWRSSPWRSNPLIRSFIASFVASGCLLSCRADEPRKAVSYRNNKTSIQSMGKIDGETGRMPL